MKNRKRKWLNQIAIRKQKKFNYSCIVLHIYSVYILILKLLLLVNTMNNIDDLLNRGRSIYCLNNNRNRKILIPKKKLEYYRNWNIHSEDN